MTPALHRAPAGGDLLALLGRTPLARITTDLPCPHPGFWAKLEGLGAGGMKARAAVSMVLGARERGELRPGAPVVESTSGTLGIGLAFAGQALGHPIVLVCDTELEPSMRRLLRTYGVRLELVDRPAAEGGWQAARLARLREMLALLPDAYWPDQYNNPDNTTGYASLAAELTTQLDHLDILVCSVGTGGHSAGLIRPLREHWPGLRLIGVDATGSTIFGQPARPRHAYLVALPIGLTAALTHRGWLEELLIRPLDILLAVPSLLLILLVATVFTPGTAGLALLVALANIPDAARLVRAAAAEAASRPAVEAMRLQGETWWRMGVGYVGRSMLRTLAADAGIRLTGVLYLVATAAFLGVGVAPDAADWAVMVDRNRTGLFVQPWAVVVPALLIVALTTGSNLLFDAALEDGGRTEKKNGRTERKNGRTERKNGRTERKNGRTEREKGKRT